MIKEINEIVVVLNQKSKEVKNELRIAHSNGAFVDMSTQSLFTNWADYLTPYLKELESHIESLKSVPLGSNFSSELTELKGNQNI